MKARVGRQPLDGVASGIVQPDFVRTHAQTGQRPVEIEKQRDRAGSPKTEGDLPQIIEQMAHKDNPYEPPAVTAEVFSFRVSARACTSARRTSTIRPASC